MDNIQQLFDEYQYYRKHTQNFKSLQTQKPYLRDLKLTKPRLAALEGMVAWARDHDLDPRWLLYSHFASRKWLFSPQWDHLIPTTKKTAEKVIERYHKLEGAPLLRAKVDRDRSFETADIFNVNRDMSGTTENIKRRYLDEGDVGRCMAEMGTVTFGYHPKSTVCVRCISRVECESKLQASVPFDIVALRRGGITLDQARRVAGRVYDNEQRRGIA